MTLPSLAIGAIRPLSATSWGYVRSPGLGNLFRNQGEFERARAYYEEQLAVSRAVGLRDGELIAIGNLGDVSFLEGRLELVREYHLRATEISRETMNRRVEAIAGHNLGRVLEEMGDASDGERQIRASLSLCVQSGDRHMEAHFRLSLGSLLARVGNSDAAGDALAEARDLAVEVGAPGVEVLARCERAALAGADTNDALKTFIEKEGRLSRLEVREASNLLWRVTGDQVHLERARQLLDEALAHVSEDVRTSMCANLRVNREIVSACEAER